ncbi:MAG: very short patch repair endonuclease [Pirellulales bacterium]
MDTLTPAARSALMAQVRGKHTKPELLVRKLVHGLGYRYRLHGKGLPGSPDLVFAGRRCVIFVHGCFWHGHECRRGRNIPASNRAFWKKKLTGNAERDRRSVRALRRAGSARTHDMGMRDSSDENSPTDASRHDILGSIDSCVIPAPRDP